MAISSEMQASILSDKQPASRSPRLPALVAAAAIFLAGVGVGAVTVALGRRVESTQAAAGTTTRVDFTFQLLGLPSPRQGNKTMNVFVRLRYPEDTARCPFSPTDNTCIQYQLEMRQLILNVTLRPTPSLPMESEWERVALAMCRGIHDNFAVAGVSTLIQVNGDGRNSSLPFYEPGAHSATCTIGPPDFKPVDFYNYLPNLGPY